MFQLCISGDISGFEKVLKIFPPPLKYMGLVPATIALCPNCYKNWKHLRIIEFCNLPLGISPWLLPCSARMTRHVNMPDSYWCNILYSLTMGTTLKIHSACFCCREPMELKLISSDSNEIGWGGMGSYDGPCSELIVHMIATTHTSTPPYIAAVWQIPGSL